MHPILLTGAVSAAGDILHVLAERALGVPAKTAPQEASKVSFSSLMDKVAAPGAATLERTQRMQALSSRLLRSAEVAGAMNETGAPATAGIQITPDGDALLRLPDGGLKPVQLSAELKVAARELYQMHQSAAGSTTAPGAPAKPLVISA